MRRTRSTILMTTGLALALAACGSGGSAEPTSVAPTSSPPSALPTTPTTPTTDVSDPSTSVVETTVPATALPDGVIGLSPDGPWRLVDSAPGITTPGLVYELMPKLWVYLPLEEDLEHGILWTFTEPDRDIIEAYLQAELTYYRAITSDPIDLELAGWDDFYVDAEEAYFADLRPRRQEGQIADLAVGVVLRPQVIGDGRSDSTAIVFDCILDGGVFKMPDGSLAPGSVLGVVRYGAGARVELVDGAWLVAQVGSQPDAC